MKTDKFLAIIVLYNFSLEESITFLSLSNSLKYSNQDLEVVVYDNSQKRQYNESEFKLGRLCVNYIHNKTNPGICTAYNYGIEFAIKKQKSWLLLLDQDSELSDDFIDNLLKCIDNNNSQEIVSIIPRILDFNKKLISPSKMLQGGRMKSLGTCDTGIVDGYITSINSGNLVRVSFVKSIGWFNNKFPLDMLDHWFFLMCYKFKKKVFINDSELIHDLSVNDYAASMTENRYLKIIKAELLFVKTYTDFNFRMLFYIRLMVRFLKQLLTYSNKRYSLITLKALMGAIKV